MVDDCVTDIARHCGPPAEHDWDADRQLRLGVSHTLHARLAREAAERGMQLEDWAVLKLGRSRVRRPSLAHVKPVSPWQTRC
jgi:hypothetical protein